MFVLDMLTELASAQAKHQPYNSHHEAYAVLLEEVEEYWEEVKKQTHLRCPEAMYRELVQVATVAMRAAWDLGLASSDERPLAQLQALAAHLGYGLAVAEIKTPDQVTIEEQIAWLDNEVEERGNLFDQNSLEVIAAIRQTLARARIDFSCKVCGVSCDIAPDPPGRAVCPEHCEDHAYAYDRMMRGHYCEHCGQQAPVDWFGQ